MLTYRTLRFWDNRLKFLVAHPHSSWVAVWCSDCGRWAIASTVPRAFDLMDLKCLKVGCHRTLVCP